MNNKREEIKVNRANFQVGVDNVIFSVDINNNQLLVLLVKQTSSLTSSSWRLPSTLVQVEESLEDSAQRTLQEQIMVENLYLEQLCTFIQSKPLPSLSKLNHNDRYLCVSYFALVRYAEAKFIKDLQNTAWVDFNALPQLTPENDRLIEYGYRRLKSKLEYSPIAFDVLPELFTLSDLYQLYTTVLGQNFTDYSNFRSRLLKLGFLIDTGKKVGKGAGRPATLYTFDSKTFALFQDKPFVFM